MDRPCVESTMDLIMYVGVPLILLEKFLLVSAAQ